MCLQNVLLNKCRYNREGPADIGKWKSTSNILLSQYYILRVDFQGYGTQEARKILMHSLLGNIEQCQNWNELGCWILYEGHKYQSSPEVLSLINSKIPSFEMHKLYMYDVLFFFSILTVFCLILKIELVSHCITLTFTASWLDIRTCMLGLRSNPTSVHGGTSHKNWQVPTVTSM